MVKVKKTDGDHLKTVYFLLKNKTVLKTFTFQGYKED